ncbi:MAG TPA: phosphatase PAP2 family protein [Dokdonella sp.]|uniref:phosphatase PAP2 family protein n=1 Tax=Dokdonella sp. TaxID=2291710 RepID=UPI002D7E6BF8|nr:phosphatase PAP2 family protein [Dokdonella sp.]HET9032905.1 phosphatase PAP2 family protein [Dokdonella sp.]
MSVQRALLSLTIAIVGISNLAHAGGSFGIDHRVAYDNSGIWKRSYQKDLAYGAGLTMLGGALFVDSETRFGRTFDQSLDAMIFTAAATTAGKFVFSRQRPKQTDDPNRFFSGRGNQSFPSGEVGQFTAIVTPFIAEYRHDHPAVWLLAALPAYDAIARVKTRGHWQSDVLVGAGIGVGLGIYAHDRKSPFFAGYLPGGGAMVGYKTKF